MEGLRGFDEAMRLLESSSPLDMAKICEFLKKVRIQAFQEPHFAQLGNLFKRLQSFPNPELLINEEFVGALAALYDNLVTGDPNRPEVLSLNLELLYVVEDLSDLVPQGKVLCGKQFITRLLTLASANSGSLKLKRASVETLCALITRSAENQKFLVVHTSGCEKLFRVLLLRCGDFQLQASTAEILFRLTRKHRRLLDEMIKDEAAKKAMMAMHEMKQPNLIPQIRSFVDLLNKSLGASRNVHSFLALEVVYDEVLVDKELWVHLGSDHLSYYASSEKGGVEIVDLFFKDVKEVKHDSLSLLELVLYSNKEALTMKHTLRLRFSSEDLLDAYNCCMANVAVLNAAGDCSTPSLFAKTSIGIHAPLPKLSDFPANIQEQRDPGTADLRSKLKAMLDSGRKPRDPAREPVFIDESEKKAAKEVLFIDESAKKVKNSTNKPVIVDEAHEEQHDPVAPEVFPDPPAAPVQMKQPEKPTGNESSSSRAGHEEAAGDPVASVGKVSTAPGKKNQKQNKPPATRARMELAEERLPKQQKATKRKTRAAPGSDAPEKLSAATSRAKHSGKAGRKPEAEAGDEEGPVEIVPEFSFSFKQHEEGERVLKQRKVSEATRQTKKTRASAEAVEIVPEITENVIGFKHRNDHQTRSRDDDEELEDEEARVSKQRKVSGATKQSKKTRAPAAAVEIEPELTEKVIGLKHRNDQRTRDVDDEEEGEEEQRVLKQRKVSEAAKQTRKTRGSEAPGLGKTPAANKNEMKPASEAAKSSSTKQRKEPDDPLVSDGEPDDAPPSPVIHSPPVLQTKSTRELRPRRRTKAFDDEVEAPASPLFNFSTSFWKPSPEKVQAGKTPGARAPPKLHNTKIEAEELSPAAGFRFPVEVEAISPVCFRARAKPRRFSELHRRGATEKKNEEEEEEEAPPGESPADDVLVLFVNLLKKFKLKVKSKVRAKSLQILSSASDAIKGEAIAMEKQIQNDFDSYLQQCRSKLEGVEIELQDEDSRFKKICEGFEREMKQHNDQLERMRSEVECTEDEFKAFSDKQKLVHRKWMSQMQKMSEERIKAAESKIIAVKKAAKRMEGLREVFHQLCENLE